MRLAQQARCERPWWHGNTRRQRRPSPWTAAPWRAGTLPLLCCPSAWPAEPHWEGEGVLVCRVLACRSRGWRAGGTVRHACT